jgi:signal transduction histidine kinase
MLHEHTMRPEKVDAAISSIDRSARTLAQLIEDLLESSRLLTGRVRLGSETVDVRALIIDSVETIRLSADNKGLSVEVSAESVPAVCGDGDRLKQAFLNVLVNAVKFTPAGGRVAIRTSPSIDAVEIAISDTGAGIAPAFLPHVFDRFRQADATAGSGLGLGLAIAKQLVELHGGTIEASSEGVGRGATFTIRLPAAAAEVPASR